MPIAGRWQAWPPQMAKHRTKWLRNHVTLFHPKHQIVFAVSSLKGRKEGGEERGKGVGRKEKREKPPIWWDGFQTYALFYHKFQNFPHLFHLSPVYFCILILQCIKTNCWFHHKPTWKQVHYIIHIFTLAEITFQLFICFDVNLLQETTAWK